MFFEVKIADKQQLDMISEYHYYLFSIKHSRESQCWNKTKALTAMKKLYIAIHTSVHCTQTSE